MMFIFLFIFQIQLIISQDLGFGKGGGEIIKSLGDLNRMNDSWLREKWLGEFLGKQINRGEKRQYTSEPIQVNFSEIKNDEKQKQIKEPVLKIDPEILREFDKNNQIELKLVIELRDESNISLVGTKEEEVELLKQKLEWYKSKIDEVLLNYSNNSNFVVLDKTSRGFVVMVNKQGFELFVNNTKILKIRLDKPVYPTLSTSVPFINSDDVQNLGYNGTGVDVCIIDSGVNASHPDLAGKIVGEYCYCDFGGGCCPDGTNEDTNAEDGTGHGTHVVGIVASQNDTYKGVAPGTNIYVVKVFDSNGNGTFSDIGQAIDKCVTWGVDIISMSLGDKLNHPADSPCPDDINTQINDAYNNNISVIASSGNEHYLNGINYPGCAPNVIAVGAIERDTGGEDFDNIYYWTNRNETLLDLLAPGKGIFSLRWNTEGTLPVSCAALDGNIMACSGTSMAAPHVAGAFAQLLEKDPTLTPDELLAKFQETGTDIQGWKRINVLAALDSLQPQAAVSACNETGYEYCYNSSFEDCTSAIAVNWYENVNNIRWGAVNDSSDPYVINNYTIGIKGVTTKFLYYNESINETCTEFGCDNNYELDDWPNLEGTLIATTAPNVADIEMALSWNTTASYWCTTWTPEFNSFIPNYGENNSIYVLNCFSDNDCSGNNYCNKTGTWDQWSCVSGKPDGQNCTSNSQCASNYCDNDNIGLDDDRWCFTPNNTYFDGEESSYCEVSTNLGIVECDERQIGDNYSSCDTGGETYFVDRCSSVCEGEDRGDTICRSSSFASGCTADSLCNGVVAGTGDCNSTCNFVLPNDTHKFYHKDNSGNIVAWLGSEGNIALEGQCFSGGTCNNPGDGSLIFRNSSLDYVGFVNTTGDLCIIQGDCSDQSTNCNAPSEGAFIISNSTGYTSYIDGTGDLCLVGRLFENVNL